MFAVVTQSVLLSVTFHLICCKNPEEQAKVEINEHYTVYGNKYEPSNATEVKTEVREYLGIPFAKPPLGDLRFAPPQPLDEIKGTL
ncbi:unnamed protein product [Dibothriocephalus latus]|uniref:Carboxylesterase type B domain-containing protein n=1 Tax=Dibothriocephalus latus TaxID=60516 RepID=A0A3P7NG13_DIBLA|nr:unnamed protein product [Dibothriocephalus latus]